VEESTRKYRIYMVMSVTMAVAYVFFLVGLHSHDGRASKGGRECSTHPVQFERSHEVTFADIGE